jgi:hypothetical protein
LLPWVAAAAVLALVSTVLGATPAGSPDTRRALAEFHAVPAVTLPTAAPHVAAPAAPAKPTHPAADAHVVRPISVPPSVMFDPDLTKPVVGDTPETLAARHTLGHADESYALANQRFDKARAEVSAATVTVQRARAEAALAAERAKKAHAEFVTVITAQYQSNDYPAEGQLLVADGETDVLTQIGLQQITELHTADVLDTAQRTQAAADAAHERFVQAQAQAQAAEQRAIDELTAAAEALQSAQQAVAVLHAEDLLRLTTSEDDTLAGAADAIREQAIASGAAREREFADAKGPAQVIAIADRALLEQAAGLRRAPRKTLPDTPPYRRTSGVPVDEQAVMGLTPALGTIAPYAGETGTGPVLALTRFDGVVSRAEWPNPGVGTDVPGTAPFRKPNGLTVHPTMPDYPKEYVPLRAELAVDAALAQLGSPYVWDAAGPTTFDCSGLTVWAWGHAGVPLGHFTGTQVHQGRVVAPNQLLPGDLILFGSSLHHVGMYLGAGYMINAPNTGDYVKVQLVSDNGDFAVAVRP